MCIEHKIVMTASRKLSVKLWCSKAEENNAVMMVARVLEYFFSTVSAYLQSYFRQSETSHMPKAAKLLNLLIQSFRLRLRRPHL